MTARGEPVLTRVADDGYGLYSLRTKSCCKSDSLAMLLSLNRMNFSLKPAGRPDGRMRLKIKMVVSASSALYRVVLLVATGRSIARYSCICLQPLAVKIINGLL